MSIRNDFFQDQGDAILRWGANRSQGHLFRDALRTSAAFISPKEAGPWPVDLCI
jgi:hypothetical protein